MPAGRLLACESFAPRGIIGSRGAAVFVERDDPGREAREGSCVPRSGARECDQIDKIRATGLGRATVPRNSLEGHNTTWEWTSSLASGKIQPVPDDSLERLEDIRSAFRLGRYKISRREWWDWRTRRIDHGP
jgi:hypothetical protein